MDSYNAYPPAASAANAAPTPSGYPTPPTQNTPSKIQIIFKSRLSFTNHFISLVFFNELGKGNATEEFPSYNDTLQRSPSQTNPQAPHARECYFLNNKLLELFIYSMNLIWIYDFLLQLVNIRQVNKIIINIRWNSSHMLNNHFNSLSRVNSHHRQIVIHHTTHQKRELNKTKTKINSL